MNQSMLERKNQRITNVRNKSL